MVSSNGSPVHDAHRILNSQRELTLSVYKDVDMPCTHGKFRTVTLLYCCMPNLNFKGVSFLVHPVCRSNPICHEKIIVQLQLHNNKIHLGYYHPEMRLSLRSIEEVPKSARKKDTYFNII